MSAYSGVHTSPYDAVGAAARSACPACGSTASPGRWRRHPRPHVSATAFTQPARMSSLFTSVLCPLGAPVNHHCVYRASRSVMSNGYNSRREPNRMRHRRRITRKTPTSERSPRRSHHHGGFAVSSAPRTLPRRTVLAASGTAVLAAAAACSSSTTPPTSSSTAAPSTSAAASSTAAASRNLGGNLGGTDVGRELRGGAELGSGCADVGGRARSERDTRWPRSPTSSRPAPSSPTDRMGRSSWPRPVARWSVTPRSAPIRAAPSPRAACAPATVRGSTW